ncbi:hypothetical protein [Dactylosporangium sp. NPDC048998]|uniref:hypothetical protein n=1 Tax=Dactylosporangium sp. NPDC048998 TaxID=3363976 RepID=UPI00371C92A3
MIVTRDSIRVGVPPMSAYEHLVRFIEFPRYLSGVLSLTPLDSKTARLVLDIGGMRIEFDAIVVDAEPGRFVRWRARDHSEIVESFWLEAVADEQTDVVCMTEVDDSQVSLFGQVPEVTLRSRLRTDLKGFKRFCEESAAKAAEAAEDEAANA